jgi:hypothetical protein
MKSIWDNFQWKRILFPVVCLILAGCGSLSPLESASPLSSTNQLAHHGTVASFDCGGEIISIASGGYFNAEFIGQFGDKRNETMSQLFVSMRGKPESLRIFYGYTGMNIYYYLYKIQVIRLGRDFQNPFTEVNVKYWEMQQYAAGFSSCSFY